MMSKEQFGVLSNKLDVLIKLTAMNALKDKTLTEQVRILSEIDLQNKQIAIILGTTPDVVHTLKGRLKKRKVREDAKVTPEEEKKPVLEKGEDHE
jgi:hypothetical protein